MLRFLRRENAASVEPASLDREEEASCVCVTLLLVTFFFEFLEAIDVNVLVQD